MVSCHGKQHLITRAPNGFSLLEALIAIVIAAILAVALTRVANNTRMNAAKIQELVRMMSLNDALLSQLAPTELGVTHGRTGRFSWQIAVAPLRFTATALRINSEAIGTVPATKVLGLSAISDEPLKTTKPDEGPKWFPVYVTVATGSSTGRKYSVDTISLVRQPKQSDTLGTAK